MKRIKLSKEAKQVLRLLNKGIFECPANLHKSTFNRGALELQTHKLAYAHSEESGDVIVALISDEGKSYILNNPKLYNPVDWRLIVAVSISLATIAVAILALLRFAM